VNKRNANLSAYLMINLVLTGILLIGVWRGEPLWDAAIRLPNLLVLLIIINTVLIFKESLMTRHRRKAPLPVEAYSGLRRVLGNRHDIDDRLLPDALLAVLTQTGDDGMSILLFEEGGFFTTLASAGRIPLQLSGARFQVESGELRLKHPGGLGEETLTPWEPLLHKVSFCSGITNLHLECVPLQILGKCKGLWVIVPTSKKRALPIDRQVPALFLENLLTLFLCRSQAANGMQIDISTGLLRYEGFCNAFETEIERSERYQQKMTLLLLSVAHFDNLAGSGRESVTKAVAAALRESLRRLDMSFSWKKAGCFAAVLTETDSEVACMVAERIVAAFHRGLPGKTLPGGITPQLHVGFATYATDASHGDGVLEKAEEALAASLERGGGVVAYGKISSLTTEGH
jgi:GGDEF domain-containing protein